MSMRRRRLGHITVDVRSMMIDLLASRGTRGCWDRKDRRAAHPAGVEPPWWPRRA